MSSSKKALCGEPSIYRLMSKSGSEFFDNEGRFSPHSDDSRYNLEPHEVVLETPPYVSENDLHCPSEKAIIPGGQFVVQDSLLPWSSVCYWIRY